MADRKSLGIIGRIMGGVTTVVIGGGIFVVRRNMIGYVLEAPFLAPSEAVTGVAARGLLVGSPAHAGTRLQNGGSEWKWTGH
jgi:hypothetical protein